MRRVLGLALLALALSATGASGGQDHPGEGALGALVQRWVTARNAHDAQAMRAIFDAKVDHIRVPAGEVIATDVDALVRWFDAGFARDGKTTTVRVGATRIRVLSADTGLVDFAFTLLGPGERRVSEGYATFVCRKGADGWKVAALRFASAPVN